MANTPHGGIRPVLTAAARAADLLLPWAGVTVWAVASGRGDQVAAVARGWAAMAVAAFLDNIVVKPMFDRERPDPERLPPGQGRNEGFSSSAFPSGHVGSAFAFAVASRTDVRGLTFGLWIIALLVTYARLYTGRHYLSDGVVGSALGLAAGWLTRRVLMRGGSQRRP